MKHAMLRYLCGMRALTLIVFALLIFSAAGCGPRKNVGTGNHRSGCNCGF
jgi:hypothetical protein